MTIATTINGVHLMSWLRGKAPAQKRTLPVKTVLKPAAEDEVFDCATSGEEPLFRGSMRTLDREERGSLYYICLLEDARHY